MDIKLNDKQITPVNAESRRNLNINSGDEVKVYQKIQEKNKTRIQVFEGVVIARKHGNEAGGTFTVRGFGSSGVGIEKTYPLYSPRIDKIEIVKKIKTRRSKLYFLRDKTQKQIRYKLRRSEQVSQSTVSEIGDQKAKELLEKEKAEEEARVKKAAEEAAQAEAEAIKVKEEAEAKPQETAQAEEPKAEQPSTEPAPAEQPSTEPAAAEQPAPAEEPKAEENKPKE